MTRRPALRTCLLACLLVAGPAAAAPAQPETEERLVFASGRDGVSRGYWDNDLFSFGRSTGDIHKLTDSAGSNDWAPKASLDGTRVVFERREIERFDAPTDIWMIDADGGGLTRLTNTPDVDERFAALSPDSRRLAYQNRPLYWVEIADLGGTSRIHLRHDYWSDMPDWSPDGRHIAYSACDAASVPDTYTCGLWVANSDGRGQPVALTRHVNESQASGTCGRTVPVSLGTCYSTNVVDYFPAWSADGRALVFHRWRGDDGDLYVINADGSDEHPLIPEAPTNRLYDDDYPDWSPDGESIAFGRLPNVDSENVDPPGIYTISPDGSGLRRITRPLGDAYEWQATWTLAPRPSALPLAPPAAPSPVPTTVAATQSARLTIVSPALRLSRRGTAAVRLRCTSTARAECRGRLELWTGRHRLGVRAYRARSGSPSSFRVRVSPAGRRLLARRRSLVIRIVAVTSEGAILGRRALLRPPPRRSHASV